MFNKLILIICFISILSVQFGECTLEIYAYPSNSRCAEANQGVGMEMYGIKLCRMFLNTSQSLSVYYNSGEEREISLGLYPDNVNCSGDPVFSASGNGMEPICTTFADNQYYLINNLQPYPWKSYVGLEYFYGDECVNDYSILLMKYPNATLTNLTPMGMHTHAQVYCDQYQHVHIIEDCSTPGTCNQQSYVSGECLPFPDSIYSFTYTCNNL
ncbi:hypothetical protein DLAC_07903 [Tieghemostelium lacteum]|uniref:Uncharacterized protein n=1 Tax=Tieghemostelium lacteum TaxID=361077 RepID=A0A151ZAN7_TIELA|nr:hypothetical protein DLAC_07903 [Tieghemostelium lacteum]|eukprot:KYQ91010.1 hypothetical protein DLAC_07903 [Tieghemostelium lacteum]